MIVVLDTNILISPIFWRGLPYDVVSNGIKGKYTLYLSAQILNELEEKLRSKFQFPEEEIKKHIEILIHYAAMINPTMD